MDAASAGFAFGNAVEPFLQFFRALLGQFLQGGAAAGRIHGAVFGLLVGGRIKRFEVGVAKGDPGALGSFQLLQEERVFRVLGEDLFVGVVEGQVGLLVGRAGVGGHLGLRLSVEKWGAEEDGEEYSGEA